MVDLEIDESECDFLTGSGREPAIAELRCAACSDGMRFDQLQCATCGELNPRYLNAPVMARLDSGSQPTLRTPVRAQ